MTQWRLYLPSVVIALGILGGTAISASVPSGVLVFAGPLWLAASVVAASALARRVQPAAAPHAREAVVVAASVLVAGAIGALSDPAVVASILPIVGATGAVVVFPRSTCGDRDACAPTERAAAPAIEDRA